MTETGLGAPTRAMDLSPSQPHPQTPRVLPALALALTLGPALVGADISPPDPAEAERLKDLVALLDHQTDLATKCGMNADYIPGMVTVLSGSDMLARGSRTVWEAIALVPGVDQGLDVTGERQLLSRGVGHAYASGNIKILLDGVSMNSSLTATANPVLNLPIEQVERIEVIRGPGSSIYGEYAYAGVVNVITRSRERTLHLQGGQGPEGGGGGVWYWQDPEQALTASVNFVGIQGTGGADVDQDGLHAIGQQELSNTPGPSNEAKRYGALLTNLQWGKTFASFTVLADSFGDHFGINHFLPPRDDRLASRQRYLTGQIGRDLHFSDTLSARVRLEAMQHERDRDDLYVFPAGYLGDEVIRMDQDYRENRILGAADLHWRPTQQHVVLLGVEAKEVKVDQATWDWQGLPFAVPPTWLDVDTPRRVLSGIAQDEFHVNRHLTLTATLRYDDYDDVGAYTSPRAAAVWRINDNNILKFQYAQAFRPPTFYELAYPGPESIDASEIATYELGYILKRPTWEAHLTLVHSDLTQPIIFDELGSGGFANGPDAKIDGIELEYQHRFGTRFKIDANLSYDHARRVSSGSSIPGGTPLLGNLALLWRTTDRWTTALQLRYVGERSREEEDSRPPLAGYTLLDLTLNWRPSTVGVNLHLGVKNLTNTDVRYPDQWTSFGGVALPYPHDYPRPGRRLWLSASYAF